MTRLLLIAVLLLPEGGAFAQSIRGAGARPCADWVQARRGGGRDFEAEQWVLGYMSGVNADRGGSVFRTVDERTIMAGVDAYCDGHAGDMLWNAVKAVLGTNRGA